MESLDLARGSLIDVNSNTVLASVEQGLTADRDEWAFDVTPKGGERSVQKQVAIQTWRDGKIVREVFYHG